MRITKFTALNMLIAQGINDDETPKRKMMRIFCSVGVVVVVV